MDLRTITPLILTLDEEANVARTIEALRWAKTIVLVDSFSSDRTVELACGYANVRVAQRMFDTHSAQWNFAVLETGIETEWILALDADYVVTPELLGEIANIDSFPQIAGYRIGFVYCIGGQPLRGSVYPPVVSLFRRVGARYVQDGHTQRLVVDGEIVSLRARILHDDRKPLSRWLAAQNRYMELEAEKLDTTKRLGIADGLRKLIIFAPPAVLLYSLFVKRTIFDGRAGIYYSFQRAIAEMILSLHLLRRRLTSRPPRK